MKLSQRQTANYEAHGIARAGRRCSVIKILRATDIPGDRRQKHRKSRKGKKYQNSVISGYLFEKLRKYHKEKNLLRGYLKVREQRCNTEVAGRESHTAMLQKRQE